MKEPDRPPSAWEVGQVLAVARATALRLQTDGIVLDEDSLMDALAEEGDIDPRDIIVRLVRATTEAETAIEGLDRRADQLEDRKARYERRVETLRACIHAMLSALGTPKFSHAECSVSVSETVQTAQITDVDKLPDKYVSISRAPKMRDISTALREGEVITGAVLNNAKPKLTIRSR